MRGPPQEDQLRVDHCDSKGSKRSTGRPRPSLSYATDAHRGRHREKDEAQEGQRWMGRHARSSALLEHHCLSGSGFTLITGSSYRPDSFPCLIFLSPGSRWSESSKEFTPCIREPGNCLSFVPTGPTARQASPRLVFSRPVSSLVENARV